MNNPTKDDIRWARAHGWDYRDGRFVPEPFVKVQKQDEPEGWVILTHVGVIQPEAPWGSPRAALRVAEAFRRGRRLGIEEMNCGQEPYEPSNVGLTRLCGRSGPVVWCPNCLAYHGAFVSADRPPGQNPYACTNCKQPLPEVPA